MAATAAAVVVILYRTGLDRIVEYCIAGKRGRSNQYSNLVEMLKAVASNSADKFLMSSELTPETSAIK